LFLEDLRAYIDVRFPASEKLSFLESENFKHNTFARMLKQTYLPKEQYFMELDKYVSKDTRVSIPLIVTGMRPLLHQLGSASYFSGLGPASAPRVAPLSFQDLTTVF
jgi:hypothetical protein